MRSVVFAATLLLSSAISAQEVTDIARAMVGYLNVELSKSRFKPMTLHFENCADTCVYKLTNTSFLEIAGSAKQVERVRLVANIENNPAATDFSDDLKAATFLYSLILWGNLPASATYDDASRFLSDLLNKSAKDGAAVATANGWAYGVVHIRCFGASTMLVALRTFSASISDVGELPVLCKT